MAIIVKSGFDDGPMVVYQFTILREGWKMNKGWVTADGRIWSTTHGRTLLEISSKELQGYIDDTDKSLESLRMAMQISNHRKKNEND